MSSNAKTFVRLAGGLAALGCVGWILLRFMQTGVLAKLWHSPHFYRLVGFIGIAIPIYALGLCCAGLAWCCLQAAFLADRPRMRPLFSTYAVTQFAKYLPGNVGHYVGRHLLLRNLGMSHRALLLATLGEAGLLVMASLVWAAGDIGVLAPWMPFPVTPGEVLIVECACVGTVFAGLQWWRRRSPAVEAWIPLHAPNWILPVLPLQLLLFGAMALSLMVPAHVLLQNIADVWLLPAAAAASWVAGFVVIGAPGGLGVREMVFLALLRGHMPELDILFLAAVFRIITFGGDLVFMLMGVLLRKAGAP